MSTENKEGKTPLMIASEKGNKEIVEILVRVGATITESVKEKLEEKFGKKGLAEILAQVFHPSDYFINFIIFNHSHKIKSHTDTRSKRIERTKIDGSVF